MRVRLSALSAAVTLAALALYAGESHAAAERAVALSQLLAGYNPTTFEWTAARAVAAGKPSDVSASEISIAYGGAEPLKMSIAETAPCNFRINYFAGGKTVPDVTLTLDFNKIRTASANIYTVGPPALLVPGRAAVTSKDASAEAPTKFDDLIIIASGQDAQNQLAMVKAFGEKQCPSKVEDTEPKLMAVGGIFADFSAFTLISGDIPYNVAGRTLSELYMVRKFTPAQATKIFEIEPCKFSIIEMLDDNTQGETEIDFNKLNLNSIKVRDGNMKENLLGKRRVITVAGKGAYNAIKSPNPGVTNDLVLLVEDRLEKPTISRLKDIQKYCKGIS